MDFNLKATLYNDTKKNPRNPANALVRFEWLEIIVRIAYDKYYRTQITETMEDSMQLMFDNDLNVEIKKYDSGKFRDIYVCKEVDDIITSYMPVL